MRHKLANQNRFMGLETEFQNGGLNASPYLVLECIRYARLLRRTNYLAKHPSWNSDHYRRSTAAASYRLQSLILSGKNFFSRIDDNEKCFIC